MKNAHNSFTLTRAELFDQIWREPMRTLAPKFGLSDVGLAKLCKRKAIPRPPMGYWARAPRKRRKSTLPQAPPNQAETIKITPAPVKLIDVSKDLLPDIVEMVSTLNRRALISVAATCPRDYPMFERWDADSRRYDAYPSNRRPSLDEVEKRRRRLLHSLIREVEALHGKIVAKDRQSFKLVFGQDEVHFTLREPSNKIMRLPTSNERRWWPERDSISDLKPSGKLRLLIETYTDRPIQKSWNDLEGKPLEDRVRDLLVGLLVALSESSRRRLRFEEEERLRAVRVRERIAAEERRQAEEERRQALRSETAAWFEANRIREYIAARLEHATHARASSAEIQTWAEWATEVARSLDPLGSIRTPVLD